MRPDGSFRLAPDRPLPLAWRAAALGEVEAALREIARGQVRDVHEARKRCKKLRAQLRLLREPLAVRFQPLDHVIRDAGRALSVRRGADVLLETWRSAQRLVPAACRPAIARGLAARVTRLRGAVPAASAANEHFARVHRALAQLRLPHIDREVLAAGLMQTYRSSRKRWQAARLDPSAFQLHEWRKYAKYHGYQCALAQPLWPAAGERVARLKRLSDLLGAHHDLHELIEILERQPRVFGGMRCVRAASLALRRRQDELALAAMSLGSRLFLDKPRVWRLANLPAKTPRGSVVPLRMGVP